ncbi:MAG: tRNA (adenosine(37)-N6)-dimethylallyltransferase MiaA [Bacteroidales bacterium]|nr:tRNA (adenosine(37)-N6)-dimethylallyltransferase MiaA [Bacteroidales bacterium]
MKTLYIIAGPTASGKTSFAIELAQKLNTEIVSADSRQIFQQLNIGVARPTIEELNKVKHHLIGVWSIFDKYNVSVYENQADEIINQLFQNKDNVVLCGGSGLYINAVINGIDDMPVCDEQIRLQIQNLLETKGLSHLQELLKEKDPEYYAMADIQNPRRVSRALEVCLQSGKPYSIFRNQKKKKKNFRVRFIGLERDREELIFRIDKRVDEMIDLGLEQEAVELYPHKELQALNTVGYKEFFEYFDNKISKQQAIELIKIHTRQYAKRQMTWFRKEKDIEWINLSKSTINIDDIL